MKSALEDYDLDLKVAELKINGFTTFEGLIPPEKIDRIREAFLWRLNRLKAREEGEFNPEERGEVRTGKGRLQFVNRYTLHVPWEPPFSDPDVYENPVLLAFLERYWGADDFHITCYHSNNPYPGSKFPSVVRYVDDRNVSGRTRKAVGPRQGTADPQPDYDVLTFI